LDREDYKTEIEEILQDENTYTPIKKNPIKNLEKNLNSIIKK